MEGVCDVVWYFENGITCSGVLRGGGGGGGVYGACESPVLLKSVWCVEIWKWLCTGHVMMVSLRHGVGYVAYCYLFICHYWVIV